MAKKKPKQYKVKTEQYKVKSEKELATENGEPWVNVIAMRVNTDSLSEGEFELDWNDIFIARLMKCGYTGKDDAEIIDQWFQDICRNVVLQTYEQYEAQK